MYKVKQRAGFKMLYDKKYGRFLGVGDGGALEKGGGEEKNVHTILKREQAISKREAAARRKKGNKRE